jgi:hypothetical protein
VLRIRVANADVVLHPSGAAFLSAEQTLLVADAHFGKAVSFRKLGVPVPSGTTTEKPWASFPRRWPLPKHAASFSSEISCIRGVRMPKAR